jgi:hypothetical protein
MDKNNEQDTFDQMEQNNTDPVENKPSSNQILDFNEIKDNYENIIVAEHLGLVGDEGRYQKFVMIILSLLSFFHGFVLFCLPYAFFEPDFYCYNQDKTYSKCPKEQACQNQFGYFTKTSKSLLPFNLQSFEV